MNASADTPSWDLTGPPGLPTGVSIGSVRGYDWSFEAGDRGSFINPQEVSAGASYTNIPEGGAFADAATAWDVHMAEGHWQVRRTIETVDGQTLRIDQELTVIERSQFQDFVVRFVFSRDSFDRAEIDGNAVFHHNANKYHQYQSRRVTLENMSERLRVEVTDALVPPPFQLEMYVRDAPGCWIVHARFMPRPPYSCHWLRWHNRLFTIGLGRRLSRSVATLPGLGPALWRRSERTGKRPNIQWQGIADLPADSHGRLRVELFYERI